jgi:hypothetical protein
MDAHRQYDRVVVILTFAFGPRARLGRGSGIDPKPKRRLNMTKCDNVATIRHLGLPTELSHSCGVRGLAT